MQGVEKANSNITIDAVITWVDGNDPKHQKKINRYLTTEKRNSFDFQERYASFEEVKYTVHSILKYAPYIRKIFIVTDGQKPKFLTDASVYNKVSIVDHKDIFGADQDVLPVFNSRSIETKIYTIPGLAEHYIYFNDDMFLLNATQPTDFFVDGFPVLRGHWHKFKKDIFYKRFSLKKKAQQPGHIKAQEKGAMLLGLKQYFRCHHTPQPQRKATLQAYFKAHRDVEAANARPKFRAVTQFIPHFLAHHLEIMAGTFFSKKEYRLLHFRSYNKPLFYIRQLLNRKAKKKNILFLNLQNLTSCSASKQKFILAWLEKTYTL
jgi:hypothetical protein